MTLFSRKTTPKLSKAEKERAKRLRRTMTASTQNTLNYQYLTPDGLMTVTDDTYSKTYHLGDTSYITATDDERIDVIETNADIFNSLDIDNDMQLLILNRRVESDSLKAIRYDLAQDGYDNIRNEYNAMIKDRFSQDQNTFKVEKYLTITAQADQPNQARRILDDTANVIESQYSSLGISFKEMDGLDRLRVFRKLLRKEAFLDFSYEDIAVADLSTRDFIAPSYLKFEKDYLRIDDYYARILYVKQYPTFLNDKLIKNILDTGIELAISLHAKPYDTAAAIKKIKTVQSSVRREMIKSQKAAAKDGIAANLVVGGKATETSRETEKWTEELQDNDQKMFSGVMTIYLLADSLEELNNYTEQVQRSVRKNTIELDKCYLYQEEALNTILPIGVPFINVKRRFMRDMTTSNLATQVPFTNVDLRSNSPRAIYYGQNQLSKNAITVDRKRDLNTGSGVIFGIPGSGKSVLAKAGEIIPTLLRYTEDQIIIVDAEDEYTGIGRAFGAEIITIAPGSPHHFNLLDLPDKDKLQAEDNDPIGQKSNLLSTLFENIFSEVSDDEFAMIDRVTRKTYEAYQKPTFKDWQEMLEQQPEEVAQLLALKAEPYTRGSNDIFAHPTNVNMDNRFIIFNLKQLSGKLKTFALLVIQDYIWNQVVNHQGKLTTWLYFDELQLYFKNKLQATFFTELYSRIRKYGAISTGITQNPETVLSTEEGRKLVANCEFMVLLKLKRTDLEALSQVTPLTPSLERFVLRPKAKGTGLIVAGDTIVPFENPIARDTKLYQLVATDG
ncbi:VirB4-like conjugal transfer ATPase, CD1110 family [Streptococcus gallolyticus]|uniref:VirB4-like conjugal transfer ATPase, CD1110 family n=1 Tax=Streptococcus gallolyticus TaxID=315405 RepID=UPI003D301450